jgi:hypothetical protein
MKKVFIVFHLFPDGDSYTQYNFVAACATKELAIIEANKFFKDNEDLIPTIDFGKIEDFECSLCHYGDATIIISENDVIE